MPLWLQISSVSHYPVLQANAPSAFVELCNLSNPVPRKLGFRTIVDYKNVRDRCTLAIANLDNRLMVRRYSDSRSIYTIPMARHTQARAQPRSVD